MKKYLLFAVALFSLFIVNPKALENANIGTYIGEGRFYSLSSYPTTQNMGFQTNTLVSGNSDLWSAIPTTTNWIYGQNGGALVQCGMSFVKDFYYSVTYNFLISSSNNYLHTSYTSWSGHQIGVCTDVNCVPWTSFDTQSTGQEIVPYLNGDYIGSFTVVFKAPQNGTCVSIAFSSSNRSTNPQHAPFVGYKYASLGSAPLTASQIQSALSSSFSELQTRIDSMKNEQQKTNSKLDDLNSKQDKTNQELKDTKDFLTDDTEADVDVSSLATVTGILPAGPVDSLLNIPFKFLSVLSSSVSGTCSSVTMNWVFDSSLTLPCFSEQFYDDVPSAIMTFLSIVPCAFILITYFKHLYKKVDRAVSMNTTADDEWGVI